MIKLLSIDARVTTESAPIVRLVQVREVTKKKLTAKELRTVKACDRIISDPATKWIDWHDAQRQLGL